MRVRSSVATDGQTFFSSKSRGRRAHILPREQHSSSSPAADSRGSFKAVKSHLARRRRLGGFLHFARARARISVRPLCLTRPYDRGREQVVATRRQRLRADFDTDVGTGRLRAPRGRASASRLPHPAACRSDFRFQSPSKYATDRVAALCHNAPPFASGPRSRVTHAPQSRDRCASPPRCQRRRAPLVRQTRAVKLLAQLVLASPSSHPAGPRSGFLRVAAFPSRASHH